MFPKKQISILEWFLKTGVMAAENSALLNGINYILKYIRIGKLFWIVIQFHNITVFDQINVGLVSMRLLSPKILNASVNKNVHLQDSIL